MVKADGYGLGAARIAVRLAAAGCRTFFVAHLGEAVALRSAVPDALLAVLNGVPPGEETVFAEHAIAPALGSLDEIERWAACARSRGVPLPALLHVDTGMSRLGLEASDVAALHDDPGRLDGIDLRYVMTHLVSAERPEDGANQRQLQRFAAARALLPAVPCSLANSSGLFLGPAFASDLARPGAALVGINPTPHAAHPLRPVARLDARVLQVRQVAAGETVGYNALWRASRPSRIAVLGVGYADGWPLALSGRGQASFDGGPVALVGRVSMDLTTYDVTDHPAIGPGSLLQLIGPDRPLERVAAEAGTIPYEILTALGRRYRRDYVN